jgi:zinc and cadmium transporter
MLASLVGIFTISTKVHIFVEKNLSLLTSFAIGVFGVVAFLLFQESSGHGELGITVIWVLIGALISIGLSNLIPEFHHHHTEDTEHPHSRRSATRILVSDGLHNIADGILITASFLAGGSVGIGIALSVLIHELVQEATEFFVLKQSGYSTKQALIRNFLVSTTILIGAVGSFYFLDFFEQYESTLLGLAAGGFLSVLLQDLIPSTVRSIKSSKKVFMYIWAILLGAAVMIAVGMLGAHEHGHDESVNSEIETPLTI